MQIRSGMNMKSAVVIQITEKRLQKAKNIAHFCFRHVICKTGFLATSFSIMILPFITQGVEENFLFEMFLQ